MAAEVPTVIEAAVNGMTTKAQNPHVPRTVDEIVGDGLRCLDAGASIIHHHNDEPNFGGATRHCAGPYIDVSCGGAGSGRCPSTSRSSSRASSG